LYSSPNTTGVIKSRRIRGVGHAASMEEMRSAYKILVEKFERKRPLRRLP